MQKRFTRRSFLSLVPAGSLAASGFFGLAGAGCTLKTVPPGEAGGGRRVVVLGAGLAGLTAAWALAKAGWDVTVLEAQNRVGGRVLTVRDGFSNGHYAEMGAIRIPDVHEHTVGLVRDLGLATTAWPAGDPVYYLQGKRFTHPAEGQPWPLAGLTLAEAARGPGMYDDYVKKYFGEFGDPRRQAFPPAAALKYDALTYVEWLKQNGASDAWIDLYMADNGSEIAKIGALAWMAAEVADAAWDATLHVNGGNDNIPRALAAQPELTGKIQLEAVVRRLEYTAASVKVTFEQAGGLQTIEADRCVCALPPTMVRRLEIAPAFADDKMRALRDVHMMNAGRAYFQTKSRFWQTEGLGGVKIAKTDTKIERIWDIGAVQGEMRTGLVLGYMQHANADEFGNVAPGDRRAWATNEVKRFFPQIEDETTAFAHHVWRHDPWVEGAWTDILPHQAYAFAALPRAEGRVHFCGEHTSIWAGWMQGAIESGKRAAAEVIATASA